jgi:hypothetical protein
MEKQNKITFCSNCSLKCIASDCECVCHTQNGTFNYGYSEGRTQAISEFKEKMEKEIIKDNLLRPDGIWILLVDVFNKLEKIAQEMKA